MSLACKTSSYNTANCMAAGMLAGAGTGAAVSCMTHYVESPLVNESPLAASVPILGCYAGLLAALPVQLLSPRIFPEIRSLLYVSLAVTAIATSMFSLGGLDMTPINSICLGTSLGAIMGIFMGICFSTVYHLQEWVPEVAFSWRQIKEFYPSACETIVLTISNLANGILAGVVSGFLVSFLSQKVPENSPLVLAIPSAGYTAALLTSIPFIAVSRFLSDASHELAKVNALFTTALVGILAAGGVDMSCMRSAATAAGTGAAFAPLICFGFGFFRGLQEDDDFVSFFDDEVSCCRLWTPLAGILTAAGISAGAVAGAVASKIGSLTEGSFAIAAVPPATLTAGIIAGYTPYILTRVCRLNQRVKNAAKVLCALTVLLSSAAGMGGVDMSLIRSAGTGAGTGALIGATSIAAFLLAGDLRV